MCASIELVPPQRNEAEGKSAVKRAETLGTDAKVYLMNAS